MHLTREQLDALQAKSWLACTSPAREAIGHQDGPEKDWQQLRQQRQLTQVDFNVLLTGLAVMTSGTTFNIFKQAGVIVNKSSGSATTVNLPSITGQTTNTWPEMIFIADGKGDAATNNITITPKGTQTINGVNASITISVAYGSVILISNPGASLNWTVFSSVGNTLPGVVGGRLQAQLLAIGPAPTDTYAATMTIDVTKSLHVIAAANGTSATATLTPSAAGSAGDEMTIITEADSSGTVTVTFASTFHAATTQATTASHFSVIDFISDGTRWLEKSRTTALS